MPPGMRGTPSAICRIVHVLCVRVCVHIRLLYVYLEARRVCVLVALLASSFGIRSQCCKLFRCIDGNYSGFRCGGCESIFGTSTAVKN